MTASQIELALVDAVYPYRVWLVVPRVSWGLNMRECDLLALSGRGYAHAIEIKVTVSDLKREFKKRHYAIDAHFPDRDHQRKWIKFRWFAVPYLMREKALQFVPEDCGILCIHEGLHLPRSQKVTRERLPKPNREALPWPYHKRFELARNGVIKYWYQRQLRGEGGNE